MTAIGTLSEAQQASSFVYRNDWGYNTIDDSKLPEGWSLLGEGSWRYALLSPSGVVYKIDKDGSSNVKEYERYRQFKNDDSRGFRFAACTFWKKFGVLAMEYVKDDGSDVYESFRRMNSYMSNNFGYTDCMEYKRKENWHGVNGVAIITDYAYGYNEN